jgi:hypothetical protein
VSSSSPSSVLPSLTHTTTSPSNIAVPPPGYMIESNIPPITPPLGCYFASGATDTRQMTSNKSFSTYSTATSHPYSCSSSGYTYPLTSSNYSPMKLVSFILSCSMFLVNCYDDVAFPASTYTRPPSYHAHHATDYSNLTSNVMCQSCTFSLSIDNYEHDF